MKNFKIFSIFLSLILSSCGGGSDLTYEKSNEHIHGLVAVNTANNEASVTTTAWQTYSYSKYTSHYPVDVDQSFEISRIPRFANTGSAYVYVSKSGRLMHYDYSNGGLHVMTDNNWSSSGAPELVPRNFETDSHTFKEENDMVVACSKLDYLCHGMPFKGEAFIYTYAKHNDSVLAISNYGDVMKFKDSKWCRMKRFANDVFRCDGFEPMVTKPRVIQFYSFIEYNGKTLLGEWPTGSVYIFDGNELRPDEFYTPPPQRSRNRVGYEAQSMAIYCGDLFVGFWPRGEIWRFSNKYQSWSYFARLFSESNGDSTLVPWISRTPDLLPSAFFGQRITALVPFEDSLYVSTSNLSVWTSATDVSHVLTPSLADEYGALWKIKGASCSTTQH